jgi:hypothetical protein
MKEERRKKRKEGRRKEGREGGRGGGREGGREGGRGGGRARTTEVLFHKHVLDVRNPPAPPPPFPSPPSPHLSLTAIARAVIEGPKHHLAVLVIRGA